MKKKVLFDVNGSENWIGGVYYIRNILYQFCCSELLINEYTPVIICSTKFEKMFREFNDKAEIYVIEEKNKIQRIAVLLKHLFKVRAVYNYHRYKIDPLNLLRKKAIYWVPDFQECYYPQFFSEKELAARKRRNKSLAEKTSPLILSSNSCLEDFRKFFSGEKRGKIYVVPFVSAIESEVRELSEQFCAEVLEKFKLTNRKYILISNQFWQHKNHIVVFRAIAQAKKENRLTDVHFVFTGELKDYRNSEYYNSLIKIIDDNNINDRLSILGFIDRKEQIALMHKAEMVLQPSLFEGWGTVVEDSKVLDKTVILSDIAVHREQMNDKCYLFDPEDSESLILSIEKALSEFVPDDVEKGINNMHNDAARYAETMEKMLMENFI